MIKVLKRINSDFNKYNNLYEENAKMKPKLMIEAYPHWTKQLERKKKMKKRK